MNAKELPAQRWQPRFLDRDSSTFAQRFGRIDARRSARRQPARKAGDERQSRGRASDHQRIARRRVEEQSLDQARCPEARDNSCDAPDDTQDRDASEHEPDDRRGVGANRHPNTNAVLAPIPRARDRTAAAEINGLVRRVRMASRRSCTLPS
jgi:hypothetical protein